MPPFYFELEQCQCTIFEMQVATPRRCVVRLKPTGPQNDSLEQVYKMLPLLRDVNVQWALAMR